MSNNIFKTNYLFLCFMVLLFASFNLFAQEKAEKGNVISKVNLGEIPTEVARVSGVLSRENFLPIRFAFDIKDRNAVAEVKNIFHGSWQLEVEAFNEHNLQVYKGSSVVKVVAGKITQAGINLHPTTGGLEVSVKWKQNHGSLVVYYPLDGNARDESGNEFHAKNIGATPTTDRNGKTNGALSFDGDGYIEIKNFPEFNNLEEFTISCWIYPTQYRRYNHIISKISPNRDFVISVFNRRLDIHFAHFARYFRCLSKEEIPLNAWTHIAAVWDGSSWLVYINGKLDNKSDHPGASPLWTGKEVSIGGYAGFSGKIDEVQLYNSALNNKEIEQLSK